MQRRLFALLMAAAAIAGCAKEGTLDPAVSEEVVEAPAGSVEGFMYVKMKSELTDLQQGPYTFTPAFNVGGRFEKRQREAGLHLWYVASFDKSMPLTKASDDLGSFADAEIVEYVPKIAFQKSFDDHYWSKQWSFYNDGVQPIGVTKPKVLGSDVNVTKAWEVTTGSPDVIVAICDSGVEYDHEDLAAHMWVNGGEIPGNHIDDDKNGIVDDVYGANFMATGNGIAGTIHPGDHGTHIAGVIAAVNNNGIGISGIAGGDGTPGTGVRLMSVQCNDDTRDYEGVYYGRAFQYATDNGAVLMNCSWEFPDVTETPQLVKDAINYFNRYAGFDENDVQTGPMAGGLCIFAAGNSTTDKCYPAMDDNVLAVSSIGADYVAAYYSNFGDWVDVAAPGGDAKKGYQIYSTVTGNTYDNMQGTSMACPHAVGVAALAVSKYKGEGFTRDMLFDILVNTANPVIYDYNTKKLGSGLVDAYAAVTANDSAPDMVSGVSIEPKAGKMVISFKQTKNAGGRYPDSYEIFVSESSLASLDPAAPGKNVLVHRIAGNQKIEEVETEIDGLKLDTRYYVRISALNSLGLRSSLTDEVSVVTLDNHLPVLKSQEPLIFSMKSHETVTLHFEASDEDDQELTFRLSEGFEGASIRTNGSSAAVTINALVLEDGKPYKGQVIVSDGIADVKAELEFTVLENQKPVVTSDIANTLFSSLKEKISVDLSKVISDPDGEKLVFRVTPTVENVVSSGVVGNSLDLESKTYGTTEFTVTATDARGETASASFVAVVRDGSRELDIYPNPVTTHMYVRTGEAKTADIGVYTVSGAEIISVDAQKIDPFNPLKVDMTGVPAGEYFVRVKTADSDKSYPIVKR